MNVYIVMTHWTRNGGHDEIEGVFKSKERAEQYAAGVERSHSSPASETPTVYVTTEEVREF